jgi:hypothetical protein
MDKEVLKFRFSQKFNLPESMIDDSLLPVFVSNEMIEKSIAESIETNEFLAEKVNQSVKTIQYDNPKTAFWGNLSIYAVPILIISMTILLIYSTWIYKETHQAKYQNFERLDKLIQVKDSVYFIPKANYRIVKNGIILIEK